MRSKLTATLLLAALFATPDFAQEAATTAKKPICGLVTMGNLNFLAGGTPTNSFEEANRHADIYSAVVILATWKQLEPERGHFDFAVIDHALDNIRKYNKSHPKNPVTGKLRVFAALNTPEWVKTLDGAPLKMSDKRGNATIGHFWAKGYGDVWRELQVALAAKYDNDPLLQEVAVSSCSSTTAEPFVIALTPENLPALHAAGYTDAGIKACLLGAVDDYSVWHNTAVDYTINEFRDSDDNKPAEDKAFTYEVMDAFRKKFGARGVLANHGLQPQATLRPAAGVVYAELERLGPPIEFQTISPNLDWPASMAFGISLHATELETWNSRDAGGSSNYSLADLANWKQAMNCPAR